ncbi:MAG: uracil-DNA glycosylase [Bdellovibrionales bacterium]|nr:uracil-DNA glycosylase [Bdellovibrionales bacterium]
MNLDQRITNCTSCPRLIPYIQRVAREKRKSYLDQEYWGRPVPNFGDYDGRVLIVGLAPAAHGANRTGRMFTGDRSGDWLYRALWKAGFASQADSTNADDGLVLNDCLITATAHCAPPDNKPEREEIQNCSVFLKETFEAMPNLKFVVCLGGIGWTETFRFLNNVGLREGAAPKFGHGVEHEVFGLKIIGSYHPSQQNTFTGRLTEPMLDDIFLRCKE